MDAGGGRSLTSPAQKAPQRFDKKRNNNIQFILRELGRKCAETIIFHLNLLTFCLSTSLYIVWMGGKSLAQKV